LGNVRRDCLASICAEDGLLGRLQGLDVEALAKSDPGLGERLRQPAACLGEVLQDAASPSRLALFQASGPGAAR
jgi:hypothetical protein